MGTNKTSKVRNFTFIIYPESIPENWEERLEKLGIPMVISPLHDLDEKESKFEDLTSEEQHLVQSGVKIYKKAHYHVLYVARNPVTIESVRNKIKRALGNQSISHIEIVDNIENIYQYLTHESSDAIRKNKHKYDKKDLKHLNDFDIDRYITLDENQKRELRESLFEIITEFNIVNIIELRIFLSQRGLEFGIDGMKYVDEIIAGSSGIFRLYFDANYQCGYRPIYSKNIDSETGEILNDDD